VRLSVRAATYRSYEQTIRNHLIPELGRLPLRKLDRNTSVRCSSASSPLGRPRSVAYCRVVLRAALNQARKWNLVVRNAAELVDPPKYQRFRIEPLSIEQARAPLEAAKDDGLEALCAVALACGLRMGEVLGLRWCHEVDLEKGQNAVSQALQRQKCRGLVLTETKTERSRRTIAVPAPRWPHFGRIASARFKNALPRARAGKTAASSSRPGSVRRSNREIFSAGSRRYSA